MADNYCRLCHGTVSFMESIAECEVCEFCRFEIMLMLKPVLQEMSKHYIGSRADHLAALNEVVCQMMIEEGNEHDR